MKGETELLLLVGSLESGCDHAGVLWDNSAYALPIRSLLGQPDIIRLIDYLSCDLATGRF